MNTALKVLGIIAAAVVLLVAGAWAGSMFVFRTQVTSPEVITGATPLLPDQGVLPYGGMMGRQNWGGGDQDEWGRSGRGQFGGMMGRNWNDGGRGSRGGQYGYGMMNGGNGMVGGYVPDKSLVPAQGEALDIDGATKVAEAYLKAYGDDNLKVTEVMQFDNHYYVEIHEKDTGKGAFEILVDPHTAAVIPEPGPNMMWNLKYGMMNGRGVGMMGGVQLQQGAIPDMTVTEEQAFKDAQTAIDKELPGSKAGSEAEVFYGYYTIEIEKDGKITGMLSVNGYTGDVWFHSWHGTYVDMKTIK